MRRRPDFNPARSGRLQSATTARMGQSDGPEVTRDRIGAVAINLSRSFDSPFFSGCEIR